MRLPPEQVISFSLLILFPHLTITGLQFFLHVGKPALLRKVFWRNSGVPFHYTAYFTTYAVMRLFQITLSCDTMPFVCELASLHNLYEMVRFCKTSSKENLNRHVPAVLDYLDDLMKCSIPSIDVQGFLARHIDVLNRPVYCRDTYNILASSIFPLFLENPCLWKIILHFGDMRRWSSLDALFRHLRNTADDSYSLSLYKLQNLLVGQFPAPSSGAVP